MNASAETLPSIEAPVAAGEAPSLLALLLIFWTMFAVSVIATEMLNPGIFVRQDPDSLMRLAGVRDLVAGQGWFDLVQHRLDPPQGSLLHWSRLIDAPIAALVILGDLAGIGEGLALTLWPLLLFFGFMAGIMLVATAFAGRKAAVPALVLSFLFLNPLLSFLPNDIDHHNAQLALLLLALAAALRLDALPVLGVAVGGAAALMLAIGLEMLPYVAVLGAAVALRWATGEKGAERGAGLFGVTFAIGTAALYFATASPQARFTCDSLSLAFVLPAASAGLGLTALTLFFGSDGGKPLRLVGLTVLAASVATMVLLVSPECLRGPYGSLSPELKSIFLDTVLEAQPVWTYILREPLGACATIGPPLVALAIALRRVRVSPGRWGLPLALLGMALALSFYQVRTIQYANALAIPVLAAWLAEVASHRRTDGVRPLKRALPLIGACLLALPLAHLTAGWMAMKTLSLASGGMLAPAPRIEPPAAMVENLSGAERECLDPASAALFAAVPRGLVLTPVFYGPAALVLSQHQVVAGPYHRSGDAILDTIQAMRGEPREALAVFAARGVDYVAICASSREAALAVEKAPDGLLADLLRGEGPRWLEPVRAPEPTMLRLWRIKVEA